MSKTFALLGNPNCGKSTLFNALTGAHQKVGNWSGVTVERKEGKYLKDKTITIVDLPGVYSLNAKSADEKAVIDYLKNNRPDVIINVLDGTNLERNLYLTTELIKLKIPMILAVGFYDQLKKNNITLDLAILNKLFGVNAMTFCALNGHNVDSLIDKCKVLVDKPKHTAVMDLNTVEERYKYIEKAMKVCLSKKITKAERFTKKADKILMGKYSGLPILFIVITLIYFVSIRLGGFFGAHVQTLFNTFEKNGSVLFIRLKIPEWITSLTFNAIVKGLGIVLSFLPQILILFALLSIVEQSGYAARSAFVVDRLLSALGLSGKSFLPMILGCGCTVSGLMATRSIDGEDERIATVYLTPFMPCSAKTVVFGWFSSVFFGGSALLATSMYFLSVLSVAVGGKIIKTLNITKQNSDSFIMEIPLLRTPQIKDVSLVLLEKLKDFLTKAGLIVFVLSVILWALRNMGVSGYVGDRVEASFLYAIGDFIKFVFYPLGFGNWQASVAVISGFMAKEAVIETLGLLSEAPTTLFVNKFSVYAFCAFILLSPPCVASIAQAYRELKSIKKLISMLIFQFTFAYAIALFINLFGLIVQKNLILPTIIVIIIAVGMALAIKKLKKLNGCNRCAKCVGVNKCNKTEKRSTT